MESRKTRSFTKVKVFIQCNVVTKYVICKMIGIGITQSLFVDTEQIIEVKNTIVKIVKDVNRKETL